MPPLPNNDTDVYIVIEDFGPLGRAILETDLAAADRETIIRNFISGQYDNALRVVWPRLVRGFFVKDPPVDHRQAGTVRVLVATGASEWGATVSYFV
jgi:hypothetical protein